MRRSVSARWSVASGTDDTLGARTVDLDGGTVNGLVPVELGAHDARQLELPADDADVAAAGAAVAHDAGQLVEDRRQERGSRIADQGDHAVGTRVEEGEH